MCSLEPATVIWLAKEFVNQYVRLNIKFLSLTENKNCESCRSWGCVHALEQNWWLKKSATSLLYQTNRGVPGNFLYAHLDVWMAKIMTAPPMSEYDLKWCLLSMTQLSGGCGSQNRLKKSEIYVVVSSFLALLFVVYYNIIFVTKPLTTHKEGQKESVPKVKPKHVWSRPGGWLQYRTKTPPMGRYYNQNYCLLFSMTHSLFALNDDYVTLTLLQRLSAFDLYNTVHVRSLSSAWACSASAFYNDCFSPKPANPLSCISSNAYGNIVSFVCKDWVFPLCKRTILSSDQITDHIRVLLKV